jgi:hypothetical protein
MLVVVVITISATEYKHQQYLILSLNYNFIELLLVF